MPDPSEDEGLHVVQRDEPPRSPPVRSESSKIEPQKQEPEKPEFTFLTVDRVILIGAIVLFVLFLFWSGYLIKQLHREAGGPESPLPARAENAAPSSTIVVTEKMLHVTSISLGNVRLAVVNGTRLAEGDLLQLNTPAGDILLRVTQIKDGTVEFKYGGQQIEVELSAATASKPR